MTYYRAQLDHAGGPRAYLAGRGLGVVVQREWPWRVGYAPPGWSSLTRHLIAAGFTAEELVGAGLSTHSRRHPDRLIDMFRDRIMFPVRDEVGHAVAFLGRAGPGSANGVPKYINSPDTAIYTKGRLLFGVAEQQERLDARWVPVLVEGPADVLAVWLSYSRSGRSGAVALAPCGTALTDTQAAILRELPGAGRGVVAAFDGDPAGRKAVDRAWQLLRQQRMPGPLRAAEFSAGADPADLLRRPDGRAQLRAALQRRAVPMLDAVVDHRLARLVNRHPRLLEDIGGRCAAVRALVPLLFEATSPDEAVRVGRRIVAHTGTGVDTVVIAALEHVEDAIRHVPPGTDASAGPETA
ncbi:toprim domain-containing protein [Micromonospora sp. ALFpr18c]|uniref:toprim domain-containing protein n=1 Tax=unclassified Micromonospora TaxID=2617518 RepID=UPI001788A885|nr:toprim domain-containing protein [Micromonospora sp. ALFpr18c]